MEIYGDWEVNMSISGAVTVRRSVKVEVVKGYHHPFLTTVKITNARHGVNVQLTSKARSSHDAAQAALFFVGEMLNVLCLRINVPLYLSLSESEVSFATNSTQRVISKDDWAEMFTLGREFGQKHPAVFSRALSWYRKRLISEDPIDKLLAFWLSLEVVGDERGNNTRSTNSDIVNKLEDCFTNLWGAVESWKVIPGHRDWLYKLKDTRNEIAHGEFAINPESIEELASKVSNLQELACTFLRDWEHRER